MERFNAKALKEAEVANIGRRQRVKIYKIERERDSASSACKYRARSRVAALCVYAVCCLCVFGCVCCLCVLHVSVAVNSPAVTLPS